MTTALSDVWFRTTDLSVVAGRGAFVETTDGDRYLDFTSGIGVTVTGHSHPRVVEAVANQAAAIMHAQMNVYRHPVVTQLAERLVDVTPEGIDAFFFTNSGAEAVEAAVKLCRQALGRPHVVVFTGGFHGRTAQTMAMTTAKARYRIGHAPQPAGVFVGPFPHWSGNGDEAECLAALHLLLRTQTAPEEVAAVVIEPVLGEGGYLPAPWNFLRGVEELCRRHGIALVLDEIQTGFGRTGRMFAAEHAGLRPDVLVMAKGMASGFPIAAIGARRELMERWPTGSHGGTYGGNPMGCAAALATIEVIEEERLVENAERRGAQLTGRLRAVQESEPTLADVRGPGLMVGCELVGPDGRPDGARAAAVLDHCRREGHLLLMTCGPDSSTVRWMPPLVVTADEIDTAVDAFSKALAATR